MTIEKATGRELAFWRTKKGLSQEKLFRTYKKYFMTDEFVVLKLPKVFVLQLIDGLKIRTESWERTKDYLADGVIDPDDPYIEECSDENEAEQIANFYREIIKEIETQLAAQSK